MKLLLSLLFLTSCNVGIKHKGLDNAIPKKIEVDTDSTFGPDFEAVLEYCTGFVDHNIETELRADPSFYISEEDREYEIDECYYNFDLSTP